MSHEPAARVPCENAVGQPRLHLRRRPCVPGCGWPRLRFVPLTGLISPGPRSSQPQPMLPRWKNSRLVLSAAHGAGNWLGAASALIRGGYIYLAYRERHAIDKGRGNRVYLARSPIDDGIDFDTFWAIGKADMDAASLERPALDVAPDGDWFLYLSCATHNSKHWRIDRLRARDPRDFSAGSRQTIFPGSPAFGIKDPVIIRNGNDLRIWATRHPLSEGDENADQMTSVDACTGEPVMTPKANTWYSRGTRITAIVGEYAYFDGRASASQNFEERTGIARWNGSSYIPIAGPVSSPLGGGALRYVSVITIPDGRLRLYYESATTYGSHELRTELCAHPDVPEMTRLNS
jgi:hypothetical protein